MEIYISKFTKMRIVKTPLFSVAIYACEIWTINVEIKKKGSKFFSIFLRRMLRIPWTEKRTKVSILYNLEIEAPRMLLPIVQCRILTFFGHIMMRRGSELLEENDLRKSAGKKKTSPTSKSTY